MRGGKNNMTITKATPTEEKKKRQALFNSFGNFAVIPIKPFQKLNTQDTLAPYLCPFTSSVLMCNLESITMLSNRELSCSQFCNWPLETADEMAK